MHSLSRQEETIGLFESSTRAKMSFKQVGETDLVACIRHPSEIRSRVESCDAGLNLRRQCPNLDPAHSLRRLHEFVWMKQLPDIVCEYMYTWRDSSSQKIVNIMYVQLPSFIGHIFEN